MSKNQLTAIPKASKPDNRAKKERLEKNNNRSSAYMREGHELGKQGELEAKAAYYNRRKASRKEQQRLKRLQFKQEREGQKND